MTIRWLLHARPVAQERPHRASTDQRVALSSGEGTHGKHRRIRPSDRLPVLLGLPRLRVACRGARQGDFGIKISPTARASARTAMMIRLLPGTHAPVRPVRRARGVRQAALPCTTAGPASWSTARSGLAAKASGCLRKDTNDLREVASRRGDAAAGAVFRSRRAHRLGGRFQTAARFYLRAMDRLVGKTTGWWRSDKGAQRPRRPAMQGALGVTTFRFARGRTCKRNSIRGDGPSW